MNRKAICAVLLLVAATAQARDFDSEARAMAPAIGGEPEQTVVIQRRVALIFVPLVLAYRARTFYFVNSKNQVRAKFGCDDVLGVEAELGHIWDNVRIQTAGELHIMRVINVRGHEAASSKMVATLKACAQKAAP